MSLCGCAITYRAQDFLVKDAKVVPVDLQQLDHDPQIAAASTIIEPRSITHADGQIARGVHMHVKDSTTVVLYFGGNGFNIRDEGPPILSNLAKVGVDVVWFDYRGQGGSAGTPTVDALYADADDELAYATGLGKRVVVQGTSMGTLVAAKLRKDPRVAGTVLDGPISTAPKLVHQLVPFYWRPFVRVHLDDTLAHTTNLPAIASSDRPLLILVGDHDDTTPFEFAQALYDAAPGIDKHLVTVKGARHGNTIKFDQARAAYRDFLASLGT